MSVFLRCHVTCLYDFSENVLRTRKEKIIVILVDVADCSLNENVLIAKRLSEKWQIRKSKVPFSENFQQFKEIFPACKF